MIIKLAIIVTICLLVVFIAYKLYCFYKLRCLYYQNLYDFCSFLSSQISFLKTDLTSLIKTKQIEYQKDFNSTLKSYLNALVSNNFSKQFGDELKKQNILTMDEQTQICNFFEKLGKTNQQDQLAILSATKQQVQEKLKLLNQDLSKKGTVNLKLGIMLALALFVIFI